MQLIPRKTYMDFLIRHQDKQIIKVVSGVRRCGKSTLLQLFRQHLLAQGIDSSHIITINFGKLQVEFEQL